MADPGIGPAVLKLTLERVVPSGIALITSWIKGKEIMVVGQARAGKTTFVQYLQYGIFDDEKETEKTKRTKYTPRFNVKMGRDGALELVVESAVDLQGQIGPIEHANMVFDHKPDAVIIFTDLTTPLRGEPDRASAAWIEEFCEQLESRWRAKKHRSNPLKSLIVVMNKCDKVDGKLIERRRREFKKILKANLNHALGRMEDLIEIIPCSVVTNPDGTKKVDSLITQLAIALAK